MKVILFDKNKIKSKKVMIVINEDVTWPMWKLAGRWKLIKGWEAGRWRLIKGWDPTVGTYVTQASSLDSLYEGHDLIILLNVKFDWWKNCNFNLSQLALCSLKFYHQIKHILFFINLYLLHDNLLQPIYKLFTCKM